VTADLSGVLPIVPTPFREDGSPDEGDLRNVVEFIIASGADGLVFPGVASEFDTLAPAERTHLTRVVARAIDGRKPFVVGASAASEADAVGYARLAQELGASAVMAMNPPSLSKDAAAIEGFYRALAGVGVLVMLQNAPAPVGSALTMRFVATIVERVPGVAYVKEEALPAGQRIGELLSLAPAGLRGVLGGAGGRYITDELARGACGTMPAAELTDLHAALWAAHGAGDRAGVRAMFNRMLPLLNFQAVFRMAMTKAVLAARGVIRHVHVRAAGPRLDAGDRAELAEMLAEVADLFAHERYPLCG
jgi:dihydrodipicolinate synthase/N-acetylneuraminate lyase